MKKIMWLFCVCLCAGWIGCSGESTEVGGDTDKPGPGQEHQGEEPVTPKDECKEQDTDGDTIADKYEGETIDSIDTDGDTIPDAQEAMNDGNPCKEPVFDYNLEAYAFQSLDSDMNGIPDSEEACPSSADKVRDCGFDEATGLYMKPYDTDKNGIPDFLDADNDGDGIEDIVEIAGISKDGHVMRHCDANCECGDDNWCKPGSIEHPLDSDGDGTPDYMDEDSNNDGVQDFYKGDKDTDGDGVANIYADDSDGDTISDKVEYGTGETPLNSDTDSYYDLLDLDSDNDGLPDNEEVYCDNISKDSRILIDTDGDEQSDMAEYVLAKENGADPKAYICNRDKTVLDFVPFFFDLPVDSQDEKSMPLVFVPRITNADILINIDNTGSMKTTLDTLKSHFSSVIAPVIKQNVKNSRFGASIFRDTDAQPVWQLYSGVVSDESTFTSALNSISINSASTDDPEGGYEALYEIASGDTSKNPKAYDRVSKPTGNDVVGGAGFKKGSMPIILHITDASSHDAGDGSKYNGHSAADAFKALNQIGARIIHIGITSTAEKDKVIADGKRMSSETNAIVPVCAYQTDDGKWPCGNNKCCINSNGYDNSYSQDGVAPDENGKCVMALDIGSDSSVEFKYDNKMYNMMAFKTMLAVQALVRYGTYNVSTRVVGQPFSADDLKDASHPDTSCFIDRIEAISYTPPENSTIQSCLSTLNTKAKDFAGKGFNDGFENFAVGATSEEQGKSQLEFKVYAKNNDCVKTNPNPRSFRATIQVMDPVTELVFDELEVVIIVPGFVSYDN